MNDAEVFDIDLVKPAAVIKANGGILENEVSRDDNDGVTQRYWIEQY
jgi:predicted acetyltransferase